MSLDTDGANSAVSRERRQQSTSNHECDSDTLALFLKNQLSALQARSKSVTPHLPSRVLHLGFHKKHNPTLNLSVPTMPTSYLSSATSTFSNLLTNTTSKYTTLRRQLLPLSSDERDGDTEDDTHVCRVLRAYYTEKSRTYPSWLPPDPRRPISSGATGGSSGGGWNSGSGSLRPELGAPRPTSGGRGLSDLFGPSTSNTPQGSLRRSEGSALRVAGQRATSPQPQPQAQGYSTTSANSMGQGGRPSPLPASNTSFLSPTSAAGPTGARPLPSQRDGSYQSLRPGRQVTPASSGYSDEYGGSTQQQPQAPIGNTAQDRLKAKLYGRR